MAAGQGDSQDAIAVIIIDNDDVIVAGKGLDNEFASEVHVGLTSGFHHRGKAQMCPGACCKARGKASSQGAAGLRTGTIPCGGCCFVDRTFWQVWSRWPLMVALELGGCCWRVCNVNPANLGTWPRRRASSRVDRDGLKRAP